VAQDEAVGPRPEVLVSLEVLVSDAQAGAAVQVEQFLFALAEVPAPLGA
jgi:hypothetical protein